MTRLFAFLGALAIVGVTTGRPAAQGLTGYPLTFQAYQQAMNTLRTSLQQSNRTATMNALIPVIAINRALNAALAKDRTRLAAASTIRDLGDGSVVLLLSDAVHERAMHALSATSWVATGDDEHRLLALAGHQASLDKTQAAIAALTPLLSQMQGLTLPPALVVDVTMSRSGGALLFLVKVSNLGDSAAPSVTLTLEKGASLGGGEQEEKFGALPPGGTLQHVFALAVPPLTSDATASVAASAPNASTEVFSVDLPSGS